jgi:hypothetical protein
MGYQIRIGDCYKEELEKNAPIDDEKFMKSENAI